MFYLKHRGDFSSLEDFLKKMEQMHIEEVLQPYAQEGVTALVNATPKDTGLASMSWSYLIELTDRGVTMAWINDNVENGFPVVIMLQMGHGTGSGGYVEGRDFINPAMQPIFERIANEVWKVVTTA